MQKKYRLTSSRGFDYIYKNGQSYRGRFIVLLCAQSKSPQVKVGFSVGKKVGGSVVRNKTKRRLKEAFRRELAQLKAGFNYVVVARASSAQATYQDLVAELHLLLAQANQNRQNEVE